jgi:DNA repair exonuclease SbcCD nuclease subunit
VEAFHRIINLCREEEVQVLLISGDLFDSVHVPAELLSLVQNSFASLSKVRIFIAPGNHDPATIDSPYLQEDFWSENVYIFKGKPACYQIEDLGVRVWGAAFTGSYRQQSWLGQLSLMRAELPKDNMIDICVLHGTLVTPGQVSDYGPLTEQQIAVSGMDYIALGHQHRRTQLKSVGKVYYAYSGCPEGRRFDEPGDQGVYLGDVTPGYCDIKYVSVSSRAFVNLPFTVTGMTTQEVIDGLRKSMQELFGDNYTENLYAVELTGVLSDASILQTDELRLALADLFFLKVIDNTYIEVDDNNVAFDYTLRGIFLRKIKERRAKVDDDTMLQMAQKLGLKAFSGKVNCYED